MTGMRPYARISENSVQCLINLQEIRFYGCVPTLKHTAYLGLAPQLFLLQVHQLEMPPRQPEEFRKPASTAEGVWWAQGPPSSSTARLKRPR